MTNDEQLVLPLAYRPAQGVHDFLVSPSNKAAWQAITLVDSPFAARLALSGPAGAGKTHLAQIWGGRMGAVGQPLADLTELSLRGLFEAPAIVLEDADESLELPGPARRQVETLLFHLLNATMAEGIPLLMTGRTPPARWSVDMPDLASRLSALPHVALQPPDDALLTEILRKLFKDRQLAVGADVLEFLIRRMHRSFEAAEDLVARLDRLSLANRRSITRPLAKELFPDQTGEPELRGKN
ncbi:MAG: DnaA/Hda family protein [Pseudomonadota bacterium]